LTNDIGGKFNHDVDPNGRLVFFTSTCTIAWECIRELASGEELTIDYGAKYSDESVTFPHLVDNQNRRIQVQLVCN
jgi:hypothetical protein